MKTALITSTGSVAADITLKSLKRMGFRVVGCNIYPKEWIVESCEMDVFYQAPPVSDQENYLAFMKDLCVKEKVEYLLPMIDYEIDLLNCNREWFEEQGVTLCMSPKESLDIIRNKKTLAEFIEINCPDFKGLEADRYSFYRVPKALVKADLFQKMSGDAKLLYAVLLDRMSLSIKNGWQDKHGNAYIICTIEEVMDSIHCARQKAVKLLDELEQEFRLIERRRQGLGKPNLLYVKDLYAGLSQSNYWKYENHTSGSLKNELPGVPKSNGSNTEKNNKTDNSETDLIYPAELQEEEQYRRYFKEALELEILEQGYPADKAVLYEILELLVETVTSRKKFLRICGEEKPKEVVKSRLMKLDSSHIQYILECLKENSTQIRNIKQYLLATLYNAPVTVDSYYSAQVRHEFGWGSRVDKN